ncbi:MAG: PfkB family carbohydrate kinase [Candidatus Heimdallarchaeota archaeon]|nr:PfkB family carbohydrate kinase [Candidatus Heimdallarchaeota archaeon]MDH5646924.1 PfkB family carbohydrate kinase [Candidatus Heimdallarchaeota archaeon]
MSHNCLIVGSVAFDHVFIVQPTIREEIPLEGGKIKNLNMTFVVSSDTQIIYGGTGSNIAYSYTLLNPNKGFLFSAVGNDFIDSMGKQLISMGMTDKTVIFNMDTARSLQISDDIKEQIIIWQPNAFKHMGDIELQDTLSDAEIQSCDFAIFSPGTPKSTLRHMQNFTGVNNNAMIFFDPGQMVNHYDLATFEKCLNYSNVLILNNVELLKVKSAFGLVPSTIIEKYNVEYIIVTKGVDGSSIISKAEIKEIRAFGVKGDLNVTIETTGAGDSYRGGMLAALSKGHDLEYACKIGSLIAAHSVLYNGAQLHKLTWDEAKEQVQMLD